MVVDRGTRLRIGKNKFVRPNPSEDDDHGCGRVSVLSAVEVASRFSSKAYHEYYVGSLEAFGISTEVTERKKHLINRVKMENPFSI